MTQAVTKRLRLPWTNRTQHLGAMILSRGSSEPAPCHNDRGHVSIEKVSPVRLTARRCVCWRRGRSRPAQVGDAVKRPASLHPARPDVWMDFSADPDSKAHSPFSNCAVLIDPVAAAHGPVRTSQHDLKTMGAGVERPGPYSLSSEPVAHPIRSSTLTLLKRGATRSFWSLTSGIAAAVAAPAPPHAPFQGSGTTPGTGPRSGSPARCSKR